MKSQPGDYKIHTDETGRNTEKLFNHWIVLIVTLCL